MINLEKEQKQAHNIKMKMDVNYFNRSVYKGPATKVDIEVEITQVEVHLEYIIHSYLNLCV